jgi:hypothetical protein
MRHSTIEAEQLFQRDRLAVSHGSKENGC